MKQKSKVTKTKQIASEQASNSSKDSATNLLHSKTLLVRTGIENDLHFNAVVPPLHLSTNYAFTDLTSLPIYDYARSANPNRTLVEKALSDLEHGAGTVLVNSGMAAINVVLSTCLSTNDLLIAPHDCYGGTYRLIEALAKKNHFKVKFIDQTDLKALDNALSLKPKLILVESPSNPLLRVVDISLISSCAHQIGALVVVDNTFLSPIFQKPLKLNADLVIHSTTKYINGHSDVVGGAIVAKNPEMVTELAWWANCIGTTGDAFDSYLTLRGMRTLDLRMHQHEENTLAIVAWLEQHPKVTKVYHPSLEDHPGHKLAKKQQTGFGSIVSIEIDAPFEDLNRFVKELKLFSLAESLGGVESLIAHPATMTHRGMSLEAQKTAGITEKLFRLSIGIEYADDLISDLEQALALL